MAPSLETAVEMSSENSVSHRKAVNLLGVRVRGRVRVRARARVRVRVAVGVRARVRAI